VKVRREQHETLARALRDRFEREMLAHLREFSPRHCEVIGDDGVLAVIRQGIDAAEPYGFVQRGPVRLYLEMMFMLGSEFDSDPQYPWAREALTDEAFFDPMDRAEALHQRLRQYLTEVAGPDHRYTLRALRRIHELERQDVLRDGEALEDSGLRLTESCYPEKHAYVGPEALRELIKEAKAVAVDHDLALPDGAGVLLALMYAMGHGVANDPLVPWVGKTLRDPAEKGRRGRLDRLESKSRLYLKRVLDHVEQ